MRDRLKLVTATALCVKKFASLSVLESCHMDASCRTSHAGVGDESRKIDADLNAIFANNEEASRENTSIM